VGYRGEKKKRSAFARQGGWTGSVRGVMASSMWQPYRQGKGMNEHRCCRGVRRAGVSCRPLSSLNLSGSARKRGRGAIKRESAFEETLHPRNRMRGGERSKVAGEVSSSVDLVVSLLMGGAGGRGRERRRARVRCHKRVMRGVGNRPQFQEENNEKKSGHTRVRATAFSCISFGQTNPS